MAQDSTYWEGETTGDVITPVSWDAPYSHKEWAEAWAFIMTSNTNRGFVIPDYANNLAITESSPAAMSVDVDSGAMLVRGRIYENTASNTLTIDDNDSIYARIDRVVVQVDFSAQTIRLAIHEGTPALTPALPTLTQTTSLYEVPLAYVWVASGAATITDEEIHEERTFACFAPNFNETSFTINALKNSEFMAFSELNEALTTNTNPPEEWDLVGTPNLLLGYDKPGQMSRGRSLYIATDAPSEGVSQTVLVQTSTQYVIKLLVQVTSGDIGTVVVTTDSAAPTTITRYIRRTGTWLEEVIFYETENDATEMTISLLGANTGDVVYYGQVLLIEGFIPGPFRKVKETINFNQSIKDDAWTNATPGYDEVDIDLDSDFQGLILPGTHDVFVYIIAKDADAYNDVPGIGIGYSVYLYLGGFASDTEYATMGYAGIDEQESIGVRGFTISPQPSGVGDMTTSIEIRGINI